MNTQRVDPNQNTDLLQAGIEAALHRAAIKARERAHEINHDRPDTGMAAAKTRDHAHASLDATPAARKAQG